MVWRNTKQSFFPPLLTLIRGVDLVSSRLSLRKYARKRVLRGRDSERSREAQRTLIGELRHLKQLHHRHLVKIIASYTDLEYISYIMEPVADLDLERFLALSGLISFEHQNVLRRFYGCLAGAVNYLHQSKIRHRDITARNILIYREEVYISDFGSAYDWSKRSVSATRHHNTPVSPDYQAPEIAKREERDSKSDMFSLGVVFLEMTTKLLGRSIVELKRTISMNARKHNSDQPYVHANLPVVLTWLDELRKGNTVEHDNEPLVWVRDLLQEKPYNRPSAKGLMKDILESPSFRSFCCFKCQGEFEDRAFEYDSGLQREGPMEDSTATKTTVAKMFGEAGSSSGNVVSLQKSESIQQWLGVATLDQGGEVPMPGAFPELQEPYEHFVGGQRIDDHNDGFSVNHYQDWYNAVELHEGDQWYSQNTLAKDTAEDMTKLHKNITSPVGSSGFAADGTEASDIETNLHDTGLGFMECGSSDSGEDVEHQMFEEYSDKSDTSSESESSSTSLRGSTTHPTIKELGVIFEVDESQSEGAASEQDDNNAYQFEEVSDDSTIEEKTQEELNKDIQTGNAEPVHVSLNSPCPRAMALNVVELSTPPVAGRIKNNLDIPVDKGPRAVTCEDAPEDDPEISISDVPAIQCHPTLDLEGPVLIERSSERGLEQDKSTSDKTQISSDQVRSSVEVSPDNVSQSTGNGGGVESPPPTTGQAIPDKRQIQYGNELILSGEDAPGAYYSAGMSDFQDISTNFGTNSVETELGERTVRFALPSPSTPQSSEPILSPSGCASQSKLLEDDLILISSHSEELQSNSIIQNPPKQLEQARAAKTSSRRLLSNDVRREGVRQPLKKSSLREIHKDWDASSRKDDTKKIERNAYGSQISVEPQKSQDRTSIPADQDTRGRQEMDETSRELQAQGDSGRFFETEFRGVIYRRLVPTPPVRQRQKARKAPRPKVNTRAQDTGDQTDETETRDSIRPIPISHLPLTVANVKAFRDENHRPSSCRNDSSLQLQRSAARITPPQQSDSTGPNNTNKNSGDMRPSSSRNPRQRTALPAINAKSLMKTAWDSASAGAPTSVMSDATKAKFSQILVPFGQFDRMHNLLRDYCKQGKASAVKFLLQKGCNPGTKQSPRRAPLLAAVQGASERHNKCVRELIKHDVNVNIKSKKSGKSALHLAVENDQFQGYVRLIWLLVNAGAETNMPDENGDIPLTKVFFGAGSLPLEKYRLEALAVLLQGGAEPNLHASGTGNTPLHLAVRRKDKWAVAMLLHKGADVNAKNSSGVTPLQMTANQFRGDLSHDHAQVLDLLLQAKALIDERAGAVSRTALHLAVVSGTAHAVKILLDYGANPRLADKNGNTAIMLAIKGAAKMTIDPEKIEDHVEIMDRLVKRLGPSWAQASNLNGRCAIEAACSGDIELLCILLVKGGLDPRSKFREGTVMEFARTTGATGVEELIERYMDSKKAT